MKHFIFGRAQVDFSKAALEKGVCACLSAYNLTRRTVSDIAKINTAYSGKILSALTECKVLYEDTSHSEINYRINPSLSVMVLDISTNIFSLSVIDGMGDCIFFKKLENICELSFYDNLYSLLSRVGIDVKNLPCGISAISVLYDGKQLERKGVKETVEGIFVGLFGMSPLLYINVTDAFSAIFDYSLCPSTDNKRTAYIRLSEDITTFCLTEDNKILLCDPSRLMLDRNETLKESYERAYFASEVGVVLSQIMTSLDFTMCVGTYIIESDRFKIDSTVLETIKRAYAVTGAYLPEIYTSSLSPSYLTKGAAKLTATEIIMSLIKAK